MRHLIQCSKVKHLRWNWARTGIKYFELGLSFTFLLHYNRSFYQIQQQNEKLTLTNKSKIWLCSIFLLPRFPSQQQENPPNPAWRNPSWQMHYRNPAETQRWLCRQLVTYAIQVFIIQPPDEYHCLSSLLECFTSRYFQGTGNNSEIHSWFLEYY